LNYKTVLFEETRFLVKHGFSWGDIQRMTTYERRFQIGIIIRETERESERIEEEKNKIKNNQNPPK